MDERIKFFVGLDAHKDSTSIEACEAGGDPSRFVGTIGPDVHASMKVLAKAGDPTQVSLVYEAGVPRAMACTVNCVIGATSVRSSRHR